MLPVVQNSQIILSGQRTNAETASSQWIVRPLDTLTSNIRNIRNADATCIRITHKDKSYDPIRHGSGRKLESIKSSFDRRVKSLSKYNISINTETYNQIGPSGKEEKKKAIEEGYLSFASGFWVGKKDDRVLHFNLPKEKKNFRVELAHRNNLNMNTDSTYEFQMRAAYAAHDAIFFQVKENGGDMKTKGRGRPPISLHLNNENEIHISINSERGSVLRQKIATLACAQEWYNFKIRIVWNRHYPGIQVGVNGRNVFQSDVSFGAQNSRSHYSKFGIYIPQQKDKDGVRDTSILFDNVKESHRQFIPPSTRHKK